MKRSVPSSSTVYHASDARLLKRVRGVFQLRSKPSATWLDRCQGLRFTWDEACSDGSSQKRMLVLKKANNFSENSSFECYDVRGDTVKHYSQASLDVHRIFHRYPPLRGLALLLGSVGTGMIFVECFRRVPLTPFSSQMTMSMLGLLTICAAVWVMLYRRRHQKRVSTRPVNHEHVSATYGYLMQYFKIPDAIAAWLMQEGNQALIDCSEFSSQAGESIFHALQSNRERYFADDEPRSLAVSRLPKEDCDHHIHIHADHTIRHRRFYVLSLKVGEGALYHAEISTENTIKIKGKRSSYSLWDYRDLEHRLQAEVTSARAEVRLPEVDSQHAHQRQARQFLLSWFQGLGYQVANPSVSKAAFIQRSVTPESHDGQQRLPWQPRPQVLSSRTIYRPAPPPQVLRHPSAP